MRPKTIIISIMSQEEEKNMSSILTSSCSPTVACLTGKQAMHFFFFAPTQQLSFDPNAFWRNDPDLCAYMFACVHRRAARKHPAVDKERAHVCGACLCGVRVSESGKRQPTRRECFPFLNILSCLHPTIRAAPGRY